MNYRIREIAMSVQCEGHWTEEDIEKFAELLIKKVMVEVVDEVQYQTRWEYAELVKERVYYTFGVKE